MKNYYYRFRYFLFRTFAAKVLRKSFLETYMTLCPKKMNEIAVQNSLSYDDPIFGHLVSFSPDKVTLDGDKYILSIGLAKTGITPFQSGAIQILEWFTEGRFSFVLTNVLSEGMFVYIGLINKEGVFTYIKMSSADDDGCGKIISIIKNDKCTMFLVNNLVVGVSRLAVPFNDPVLPFVALVADAKDTPINYITESKVKVFRFGHSLYAERHPSYEVKLKHLFIKY